MIVYYLQRRGVILGQCCTQYYSQTDLLYFSDGRVEYPTLLDTGKEQWMHFFPLIPARYDVSHVNGSLDVFQIQIKKWPGANERGHDERPILLLCDLQPHHEPLFATGDVSIQRSILVTESSYLTWLFLLPTFNVFFQVAIPKKRTVIRAF